MSSDPSTRYAAALLRGVVRRIDSLEQAVSEEGIPNLLRAVTDRVGMNDSVAVSTVSGATFVADSSSSDGADLVG